MKKRIGALATSVVAACLVVALTAGTARAVSYSWNVASGDWFTASNWTPSGGPPGSTDDAVISNNGTVTLDSPGASIVNLTLSSGTLTGNGDLQVAGAMSWSGNGFLTSLITGSGTITVNGLLTINAGVFGAKTMNGRTLVLAGGGTYTGNSSGLGMTAPAAIINNATFDFVSDSGGNQGITGTGTFTNNGTLRKQTGNPGTSAIDGTFNNNGTVDALAGTLTVGGGTSTAGSSYSVSAGATLVLAGTGQSLASSTTISGAGTMRFAGTTTTVPGSYSVAATQIAGGTTTFSGANPSLGNVTMNGNSVGTFTSSTAVSFASLTFSNSTLNGSADINVAGAMSWTGNGFFTSLVTGSGTITVNGLLTINATVFGAKTMSGRTLVLSGGGTFTGSAFGLGVNAPAIIVNNATFEFVNDGGATHGMTGSGTFINNGTLRKPTGNTGTGLLDVTFNNTGTVEGVSGTLSFPAAYTQTAGVTRLNGGAISKTGSSMNIQGGTLEGVGTLTGSVNNSGGTLSPGLSAGQLSETGAYTQGASGAFTVEIGGLTAGTQYDRAAISGAASLSGTLNISLINGFEPNINDTFTIMTFGSRTGDFTTVTGASIGNGKVFQKTVSATVVTLVVVAEPTATATATETPTPTPTLTPSTTPTTTVTATPTLSHFTCYQVKTSSGATTFPGITNPSGVTLDDQFGPSSVAAVKKTTRLCAPTQKNSEPPPAAPDEHLITYQIKPALKFLKLLNRVVTDQFGARHYDVLKPAELMVPTAIDQNVVPPPLVDPSTDHFQCYKLKDRKDPGKFVPVQVTLVDAFQTLQVTVKKPTRLCAPVNKNGEDPTAPDHPDHLLCYQVKDLKQPPFELLTGVDTANQFGSWALDVRKPAELCVPALVSP